jgi:hypothetical protein
MTLEQYEGQLVALIFSVWKAPWIYKDGNRSDTSSANLIWPNMGVAHV